MRGFGLSIAPLSKHNERFARQYRSTRFSPDFALSQAAFTAIQVLTLLSYSNHFQDHGMYTYACTYTQKCT